MFDGNVAKSKINPARFKVGRIQVFELNTFVFNSLYTVKELLFKFIATKDLQRAVIEPLLQDHITFLFFACAFNELKKGSLQYAPVGALVGIILAAELIAVLGGSIFTPSLPATAAEPIPDIATTTNTAALGNVLYTDYAFYFQIAGLVLLVAMIGAIVLTLQHKVGVKRQNIASQVARTPATAIEIKKVQSGKGL